jgi:capsular polysaccharide export protein
MYMPASQSAPRSFLFLQGPHGPFFARLAEALREEGHSVHRINLCGGDRYDWTGSAKDFRCRSRSWPVFLQKWIALWDVSDVVLYGDCRPNHKVAHAIASEAGIRIWVFEEGYIRPDWMTLEQDGVNGYSAFSRRQDDLVTAAQSLPRLPDLAPVPSSLRRRLWQSGLHVLHTNLQIWRFPFYRTHRPTAAWREAIGWARKLLSRHRTRERARDAIAELSESSYFIFPLQLNSDYQIRLHSPFADMTQAIVHVIESFARHAPRNQLLAIKQHPLDNGLINWQHVIDRCVRELDLDDRIIYIEGGDIAKLVARARGVVTINSTTGTLALNACVPTIVLGQAVYDVARVTHQGDLDQYWCSPQAPEAEMWDALRRVLCDRCLIRGGLTSEEGLDLLVAGTLERFDTDLHSSVVSSRAEAMGKAFAA